MRIDHTIIITGGANGIGKGIALAYAEQRANIVIADIESEAGKALEKHINDNGANSLFIQTDVRNEQDIIALMKNTAEKFGKIHTLINNAGVSKWKSPYELKASEWDDMMNINLRSVFLCSREAAKYMKKNEEGGSIINLASTRATMSEPHSEAYAASKGGIVALTHALAVSLGHDRIIVNAISPGWIETNESDYKQLREVDHEQHPSGRVGTPADIARACLYLSSKDNDFITGINLVIDGGMTRKMIYEP